MVFYGWSWIFEDVVREWGEKKESDMIGEMYLISFINKITECLIDKEEHFTP